MISPLICFVLIHSNILDTAASSEEQTGVCLTLVFSFRTWETACILPLTATYFDLTQSALQELTEPGEKSHKLEDEGGSIS